MTEVYKGIGKLIEEMGEVNQILGKLIPFPQGIHPDNKGNLKDRLADELADLEAAIRYIRDVNQIDARHSRYLQKYTLFWEWGLTGIPDDVVQR